MGTDGSYRHEPCPNGALDLANAAITGESPVAISADKNVRADSPSFTMTSASASAQFVVRSAVRKCQQNRCNPSICTPLAAFSVFVCYEPSGGNALPLHSRRRTAGMCSRMAPAAVCGFSSCASPLAVISLCAWQLHCQDCRLTTTALTLHRSGCRYKRKCRYCGYDGRDTSGGCC